MENIRFILKKKHFTLTYVILILILIGLFFFSLGIGRFNIPFRQVARIIASMFLPLNQTWSDKMENIVLIIRMPRVIAAVLTGASLALSGATYQGIFKNNLVSPDLLGVSAGAGVGASLAILLHLSSFGLQILAFVIGISTVAMTLLLPKILRNKSALTLVLSGIIISGFMNAILGLIKYVADSESELPAIVYWLMGSFSGVQWDSIKVATLPLLIAMTILLLLRWRINILSLGDIEAQSIGMNVNRMRGLMIVCATILTASSVCISGTIGWVGLVIPHLSRLIIGEDNRQVLPVTVLLGASFMLLIDTIARNISAMEIPLSILTGIIGTPLFVAILLRKGAQTE